MLEEERANSDLAKAAEIPLKCYRKTSCKVQPKRARSTLTVGIVTERDLVIRVIAKNLPHVTPVSEVMSSPLLTIDANVSLKKAARLMGERKIRRLPVSENGGVVGVLVASDVLRRLSNKSLAKNIWETLGLKHQ